MAQRRQLLAGAAAVALAAVLFGPGATTPAYAASCEIPDDSGLRQGATLTDEGYYAYQAWLGNETAQVEVDTVDAAVTASFGAFGKEDPNGQLARGYLGTAIDHVNQRLVLVVDPAIVDIEAVQRRLSAVPAASLRTEVRAGCFSAAQLLAAGSIIDAREWHPEAATVSFGGRLDANDSRWHMTFWPEDAAVAQALQDKLGDLVRVDYGTPERLGRYDDNAPHWGGAGIRGENQISRHWCTSGFTVRLANGVYGTTTAGHCFNNSTRIESGPYYFGTVGGKFDYPTYDMEWVASRNVDWYAPVIWANPDRLARTVVGAVDATAVGKTVCHSGATTLAVCGIIIRNTSAQLCTVDGCTYGLLEAEKPGVVIANGGDSGAPVYTVPSASGATIRGMLIGRTDVDNMVAEHWSSIRNHLDVSIVTG